jgi:phosphoenolpyruvate carboxykinase (ATP)
MTDLHKHNFGAGPFILSQISPGNMGLRSRIHYQLPAEKLVEQTLLRKEGTLSDTGALVVTTGEFTGRSPEDKFTVKDALTASTINWNKFNIPFAEENFLLLRDEMIAYFNQKEEVWMRDAYACAHPDYRLNLRVVNENPWSNLFAANMFLPPDKFLLENFEPEWLILQAPGFKADPLMHGTRKGNFTVVSFTQKTILIGGSGYTGEIKKGIFSVLNFILPYQKNVLSMHCSANEGAEGDTALFFGLSGTGKTTLSSDPCRKLIGDDEHGWNDQSVFNCEGGCYAKVINLSSVYEPEIFQAIRTGALVENTTFINDTNVIDFKSKAITENTRVSYPINFIKNAKVPSISGTPENLFFLTCDAYGVFPPISKLTNKQAMYYFINGYTAKIAGTEEGVREPQATFSACFGAPFLPLHPEFYAELLHERLEKNQTKVWMVNTGWTGGAYGTGERIKISYTRAMITAALNGQLDKVAYLPHPVFGILIPQSCPGVPADILNPWHTWADQKAYDTAAAALAKKFREHSGPIQVSDM